MMLQPELWPSLAHAKKAANFPARRDPNEGTHGRTETLPTDRTDARNRGIAYGWQHPRRQSPRSSPTPGVTLEAKRPGERSAGKPPAPFDVAGVGDGLTAGLMRHSQKKWGATDRPSLRGTAPALDPTGEGPSEKCRELTRRRPTLLPVRFGKGRLVCLARGPGRLL